MSGTNETCEYVLDPDDPETWGGEEGDECYVDEEVLNDEGVWTCPHDAEETEHLCIFHLPVEKKRNENSIRRIGAAVQEYLENDDSMIHSRKNQFIGAKFETFELPGQSEFGFGDETSINLQHTKIQKGISCRQVNFELDISFDGSSIWGESDFSAAKFRGDVVFEGVNFYGQVDFSYSKFENRSSFAGVNFYGQVDFSHSKFESRSWFAGVNFYGQVDFSHSKFESRSWFAGSVFNINKDVVLTEFKGSVDFSWTKFEGFAVFEDVQFKSDSRFSHTEFREDAIFSLSSFENSLQFNEATFNKVANFNKVEFKGKVNFSEVVFNGSAEFSGSGATYTQFNDDANFTRAKFNDEADFRAHPDLYTPFKGNVRFRETEFKKDADFKKRDFSSDTDFVAAEFNGDAEFSVTQFQRGDFSGSNCTNANFRLSIVSEVDFTEAELEGADFTGANLSDANLERAKLSSADLFGTDLSGVRIYGARIGDVAINTETTFDKHRDSRCVYDPKSGYDYDPADEEKVGQLRKAMGAYHVLEQLTRANTLPDEQAKFFTRRQDMRRAQLREDGRRLEYWFAEAQNAVFRHGESFSRVVAWAVGTIVAFALLYPIGGWLQSESTGAITYSDIANSPLMLWKTLHHSALLFLTGSGPLTPTGTVGELLVTIEAMTAPVLLALLVFVLGRRAAR